MAHVNHVGLGLVLSFPKLSPKAVKNNNIKHGSNDQHCKKKFNFFWNVFVFSEVCPIINFSSNILNILVYQMLIVTNVPVNSATL